MSDVARALEMKRPALYHYFPNLEAICHVVLGDLQERIRMYCIERMAPHRHPIDQLEALVYAALEFHRDYHDDVVALTQLWASGPEEREAISGRERAARAPQRHFLIALVQNGIARGVVAECDPVGLVDTIITLTEGMQALRVTTNPDLEPMLAYMREHILGPLRIPKKEGQT